MILFQIVSSAQVSGTIKNSKGDPLPFASIYVKGTTMGTFSNESGEYKLNLNAGSHSIIYKYVGYASKEIQIKYNSQKIQKDVILENDDVILKAVIIKADTEDPAYTIIRNAMKLRNKFKNKPINFKSNIYQKFKLELLAVPTKIFGYEFASTKEEKDEIKDMLDTNKNVLIVTETISELFRGEGNQWKETITSSKISGDSKGYSNMSYLFTDINFYNNYITIGRQLISPIAYNAMFFYKYKLLGTFIDDKGNLINKIQVIPKRKYDPVFSGYIFITDKIWNIYVIDLTINSNNTNIMIVDTINIKQDFIKLSMNKNHWGLSSQYASLTLKAFGFKAKGYHTRNFINYDLNQNYPDGFFNKVKIKVKKESNKRDSIYWEKIRPIPLSIKERKGYHRMDSIETYTSSREYLDSIDIENNKLKLRDIIFSYSHRNSYNNINWSINSPLSRLNYNPVQGFHTNIAYKYRKYHEDKRYFKFKTNINYGLADKKLLPQLSFEQMLDNKSKFSYNIGLGQKYSQPGEIEIMSNLINSLTSLFQGKNYLQFYKKDFLSFKIKRNFISGINLDMNIAYSKRTALKNNSDFMFITDNYFTPNIYELDNDHIKYEDKLNIIFTLMYKPGTKYMDMPYEMLPIYSKSPWLWIQYNKAFDLSESFISYDLLKAGFKGYLYVGLLGKTIYSFEGGKFLTNKKVDKIDDIYFPGNDRYYITRNKFNNSFHLKPFYSRSNYKPYITLKLNHNFKGFSLNKIPLLNKLKAEDVLTFNSLFHQDEKPYYEIGIGMNKIVNFVSLRYSWGFKGMEYYDHGFTFSLNFPANLNL